MKYYLITALLLLAPACQQVEGTDSATPDFPVSRDRKFIKTNEFNQPSKVEKSSLEELGMTEARKATLQRIEDKIRATSNEASAASLEPEKNSPEFYISTAKEMFAKGERKKAAEFLHEGVKENPNNSDLQLALAKSYTDSEQPELALEVLAKYKGQKTTTYWNYLGLANDKAKNSLAAQDAFKEGLRNDPENRMLWNNLGLSYIFSGKPAQAVEIFEQLTKDKNENSAKYRANLALAYGASGQEKKAEAVLQKDLKEKEIQENLLYYRELRKGNVKK